MEFSEAEYCPPVVCPRIHVYPVDIMVRMSTGYIAGMSTWEQHPDSPSVVGRLGLENVDRIHYILRFLVLQFLIMRSIVGLIDHLNGLPLICQV